MTTAELLAMAMDRTDEQVNPASGKYSVAWWYRQLNHAKNVLAHTTGFNMGWQSISTVAGVRQVALPTSLCWGIVSAYYDGAELEPITIDGLDEDRPGWLDAAMDTPQFYTILNPNIELFPAPLRTVTSGASILAATAGGNFSNQPTNDGVEILSASPADTTQTADIYGTTYQTNTVVKETVTLTGTTVVTTAKTDWGEILGVELSAACAGNVTIREASGNATITTITAAATTAGIATPTSADGGKARPTVYASSTSTATVGLVGTDDGGTTVTDNAIACSGTAGATGARKFPYRMNTVTKVLLGAVASAQNVVVLSGGAFEILCPTVPTDLSGSQDIVGLPVQFHYLIADGAAAIAQGADLYGGPQQGRVSMYSQVFWDGVAKLSAYLTEMQHNRARAIPVSSDYQDFYK